MVFAGWIILTILMIGGLRVAPKTTLAFGSLALLTIVILIGPPV